MAIRDLSKSAKKREKQAERKMQEQLQQAQPQLFAAPLGKAPDGHQLGIPAGFYYAPGCNVALPATTKCGTAWCPWPSGHGKGRCALASTPQLVSNPETLCQGCQCPFLNGGQQKYVKLNQAQMMGLFPGGVWNQSFDGSHLQHLERTAAKGQGREPP